MLNDRQRWRIRPEHLQRFLVFLLEIIRWIEEDDVGLAVRQVLKQPALKNLRTIGNPQRSEIVSDHSSRSSSSLDENNAPGSPAQRFNAHCSCTRIRIQKRCAINLRRKYVEQCFPQAIRCRTGIEPG